MTNEELYKVMRQVTSLATGLPLSSIFQENPNAKTKKGEYCSISCTQAKTQRGQANIKHSDTAPVDSPIGQLVNVKHDVYTQLVAEVSVNFYRGVANDHAFALFQANKQPDVSALLFSNKVGWRNAGPVNNLTALQSESFESRAQVTIFVMYEVNRSVDTNAIYSVGLIAEDEDTNVLESITITSPNP